MIGRFFVAMWHAAAGEIDRLRWAFIAVLGATLLGALPVIFFRLPIDKSFTWLAGFSIFSAYRLFSIRMYINAHVAGESLEFFSGLTGIGETADTKKTSLWKNELASFYWSLIKGIFLAQSVLFLMLPLYVNYTAGNAKTAVIISIVAVVISIGSATFFVKIFRTLTTITVCAYCVWLVFALFPSIAFQFNHYLGDKLKVSSIEAYQIANETESMRAKQRESIKIQELKQAREWQRNNPGQDLPYMYKKNIDEVGQVISFESSQPEPEKKVVAVNTGNQKFKFGKEFDKFR